MKQFKKLGALILSVVLLLAALPMALSASADASTADVQLDFAANQYAVNATARRSGVDRAANVGLYATKAYNYITIKAKVGSAVVATFTIPEGAEAPIFKTAATADGIYSQVEAVADGGTYTIEALDKAYLQISLPVCSKEYALKTLAFNSATDKAIDFTAMAAADTSIDMNTVDGVYDFTPGNYFYHSGQKRMLVLADGALIFKVAPGSAFAAKTYRSAARNLLFQVSEDGMHWTDITANAYESANSSYSIYNYYVSSVGAGNQFIKLIVSGTKGWDAYTALYSVSYEKATAAAPVAEERVALESAVVPSTSTTVDINTLNFKQTFSMTSTNPMCFIAGGENIERNGGSSTGYTGTLHFTAAGGYAVFKTDYNSPFIAEVRNYAAGQSATKDTAVAFEVSPDGVAWTAVTPVVSAGSTFSEGQLSRYTIPAIGAKNQYVRVIMNGSGANSVLNYIRTVAFNQYETLDYTYSFASNVTADTPTNNLNGKVNEGKGLVGYVGNSFVLKAGDLWVNPNSGVIFETPEGSPLVINYAVAFTVAPTFYGAPSMDGPWTQLSPMKTSGTQHKVMSIGAGNKYVKVVAGSAFMRLKNAVWNATAPTVPAEVTALDVALHSDAEATALNATVTYDPAKLTYKGFYDAKGEATVTDNGNGTLTVSATAASAVKGDWLKLVFLPAADVVGSADVTVTTAAGTVTAPVWFDTAEEGKVLVEFDAGDSATTTVVDASTEVTAPAVPAKAGYTFAGWYTTTGAAVTESNLENGFAVGTRLVAKWVDAAVSTVKAQVSNGTTAASEKTNLRVVATLDTLNYAQAGFEIQIAEGTVNTRTVTKVYNRLKAADESLNAWDDAAGFSEDSRFFYTFNIRNIPQANFGTAIKVTPFWVTYDGTKVYGTARTVNVTELL